MYRLTALSKHRPWDQPLGLRFYHFHAPVCDAAAWTSDVQTGEWSLSHCFTDAVGCVVAFTRTELRLCPLLSISRMIMSTTGLLSVICCCTLRSTPAPIVGRR